MTLKMLAKDKAIFVPTAVSCAARFHLFLSREVLAFLLERVRRNRRFVFIECFVCSTCNADSFFLWMLV